MVTTHDNAAQDPQGVIAALQRQLAEQAARHEALAAEKAELAAALARRNVEYAERIGQQSATIDVLRAMVASPEDARPVLQLIVDRARAFCESDLASMALVVDGMLVDPVHSGFPPAFVKPYEAAFPRPVGEDTLLGRAVLSGEVSQMPDNLADPSYARVMRTLATSIGTRSHAAVPLRRGGVVIGAMVIARQQPGTYTEAQMELLRTFAEQAVIALGSAGTVNALQGRTAELARSLEQQTAVAEVLAVINANPGELAPVFDTILEKAHLLCGGIGGNLALYEGGEFRRVAYRGMSGATSTLLVERPNTGGPRDRLIQGDRFAHVADLNDPTTSLSDALTALRDREGLRSFLLVPMRRDGALLGYISANWAEPRPDVANEVALLESFAAQAVIAMENARLVAETREALERQTAMAEVLQLVNTAPTDLGPVFDAIAARARELCDAQAVTVYEYDGRLLSMSAHAGYDEETIKPLRDSFPRPAGPETLPGRVILAATPVIIPDIAADPGFFRPSRSVGTRSGFGVPLLREGHVRGCIVLTRFEIQSFTASQIALIEAFAAQAVIAMENARLVAEMREALERQTATAEVLQVINASPGDITPVFKAIMDKAVALCPPATGVLSVLVGDHFEVVAHKGLPPAYADHLRQGWRSSQGGLSIQIMQGSGYVHTPDLAEEHDRLERSENLRAMRELGDYRTVLWIALRKDGQLLGLFTLGRTEPKPFTEAQIALLRNFADQAVIAMENARLMNEQREALARQTAMADVLRIIGTHPGDVQPVFDAMLDRAMRLCEAPFGALFLADGPVVRLHAHRNLPQAFVDWMHDNPPARDGASLLAQSMRDATTVNAPDLMNAPSFRERVPLAVAAVELGRIRSICWVPLLVDDKAIGLFAISRPAVRAFTDRQLDLLRGFAAQAVIAMDNARLLGELRERTSELAERNDAFAERIDHQAATIDVLKAMSASPGDPQPVFDLIAVRARDLCDAYGVTVFEYDGTLLHWRSATGVSDDPAVRQAARASWPAPPPSDRPMGWAIAERQVIHVRNNDTEPRLRRTAVEDTVKSSVAVPMMRQGVPIGVLMMGSRAYGGFSDTQVELLKTFAEQAVIAITSAETYRALQTRTSDLQVSLEYQTATSDVLKVISQSTFDLQPVFDAIVRTAVRLCDADFANIANRDGDDYRIAAIFTTSPDFDELMPKGNLLPVTRQSLSGRAVLSGQVAQTENITTDPDYNMGNLEALRRIGVGTVMTVPLIRDGVVIGTLSLGRRRVQLFAPGQIDLIRTFADQAVIAIENARLLNEQKEALEQQTATAEVLEVINANPGNLTPVFDAILEKSLRICRSAFGGLEIFDGKDGQTMRSERGLTPALAEFRARNPRRGRSPNVLRMLETKRPVHQLDIREGEGYRAGHPNPRSIADLGGARTLLLVPLIKEQTVMGVIQIYRQEVRAFSDKEIALLENFAAQAVIAMETARLMTERREALERQTATAEVLAVINASPGNLAPVFDTILNKAHALCGADLGSLGVFEDGMFRKVARYGYQGEADAFLSQPYPPGPQHAPLLRGEVIHVPDVIDHRWPDREKALAFFTSSGLRTWLEVPLWKDGALVGTISGFRRQPRPFSDKEIALLNSFAAQAVIAMENARLLNEIKQRQGELDVTFESMGDGVALFDETHHLAAWNQNFQDMLDVPTDIVAKRPAFVDYIHYLAARGEYGVEPEDMVRRLLAQPGQRASFERTRPNGQTIQIRTNPTPTGGFVVMYTDITERKRAEEALRATRDAAENALRELKIAQANLVQSEKMASLGQLTAGIAHEIKNPLNFVNNFAALSVDLLAELNETAAPGFAALTDDQRADIEDVSAMLTTNLRKIEEHGKRADGIVKAMLEHSRSASGERRAVDINTLVDEALNLAYHGARAQDPSFNITLERDFANGLASIEVNPQDLTRAFLNIFSNGFYAANKRAREVGGEPPMLRVATRGTGDAVEIRVRDNGTGIPPDIRDKLFQPFFTTKPTGEGTGLGLSITYDIVTKQHGGTIAVDSEAGAHTEFLVTLPRHMFAVQGERS